MKKLSELLIELKSFDTELDALEIEIEQLPGRETETYFTTDEAVAYVKNKLLKDINKLLPYHVLNGSVIYVKSELDEWLNDINNDETRCKPTL